MGKEKRKVVVNGICTYPDMLAILYSMFGFMLVASILLALAFGVATTTEVAASHGTKEIALWVIVAVFVTHVAERFDRHVLGPDRESYLRFIRDRDSGKADG